MAGIAQDAIRAGGDTMLKVRQRLHLTLPGTTLLEASRTEAPAEDLLRARSRARGHSEAEVDVLVQRMERTTLAEAQYALQQASTH